VADVATNQRLLVGQGVATSVPIAGWSIALAALLLGLGARLGLARG
jgi:hypothetical protein